MYMTLLPCQLRAPSHLFLNTTSCCRSYLHTNPQSKDFYPSLENKEDGLQRTRGTKYQGEPQRTRITNKRDREGKEERDQGKTKGLKLQGLSNQDHQENKGQGLDHHKLRNREKLREYKKKYDLENKEKNQNYFKSYQIRNREKISLYNREYFSKNKEKLSKYKKKYDSENPEKTRAHKKKYRVNNREKKKEYYLQNRERIRTRDRQILGVFLSPPPPSPLLPSSSLLPPPSSLLLPSSPPQFMVLLLISQKKNTKREI
jgi:hypothetical protein